MSVTKLGRQPMPRAKVSLALALAVVGVALLAHSIYLFFVKVSHVGTYFPAVFAVGLLVLARWREPINVWLRRHPWWARLWRINLWAWGAGLLAFGAFAVLITVRTGAGAVPVGFVPQWIVVLGSSTPREVPSPALRERLEQTLRYAQAYPQARVVTSGGVDFGEVTPESRVMARYLAGRGLAPERIVEEDRSNSTYENLTFTRQILLALGAPEQSPVLIVTSDFHTMRAAWIAQRAGLQNVYAAGAPTPLYMRYNAWLRELFACVSGFLLGEF